MNSTLNETPKKIVASKLLALWQEHSSAATDIADDDWKVLNALFNGIEASRAELVEANRRANLLLGAQADENDKIVGKLRAELEALETTHRNYVDECQLCHMDKGEVQEREQAILAEMEQYRGIAEQLGATKAVSDRQQLLQQLEQVKHERNQAGQAERRKYLDMLQKLHALCDKFDKAGKEMLDWSANQGKGAMRDAVAEYEAYLATLPSRE